MLMVKSSDRYMIATSLFFNFSACFKIFILKTFLGVVISLKFLVSSAAISQGTCFINYLLLVGLTPLSRFLPTRFLPLSTFNKRVCVCVVKTEMHSN